MHHPPSFGPPCGGSGGGGLHPSVGGGGLRPGPSVGVFGGSDFMRPSVMSGVPQSGMSGLNILSTNSLPPGTPTLPPHGGTGTSGGGHAGGLAGTAAGGPPPTTYPAIMAPAAAAAAAMGMIVPEIGPLGPLGLPMLKKPKNMQMPTQDMSIPPNQTIYINNINDKIKLPELKENLRSMFKQFGEIRQIVAMSSFWRRGQAWIVFAHVDSATKAIQGMQGFVYQGQPLRINYSITKSDTIAKEDGTFVPRPPGPKKPRAIREREERQRELFLQMQQQYMQMQVGDFNGAVAAITNGAAPPTSSLSATASQPFEPVMALARKSESTVPGAIATKVVTAIPAAPPPVTPAVDMNFPALPNKVLFLENLPENTTQEDLVSLFSKYPGMVEVRPVLWRRVAFVEYENEMLAASAMNSLQGYNMNGSHVKITYARK